ncbi:hypothetical protein [Phyllobacterium sp. SB3]|uniref:hypothetical protein n=1 Tax=Phyllobacterium sp. SB3 TaxID=3156073 RepID=UPI0032AF9473
MGWPEIAIALGGLIITAVGFFLSWKKGVHESQMDYPTVEPTYTYCGPLPDWLIVRFITQNNSHVRWEVDHVLLTQPVGGKIVDEKTMPRNGPVWDPGDPDVSKLDMSRLTNSLKLGRILASKGAGSASLINGDSERAEDALWIHLPFHLRSDRLSISLGFRSKELSSRRFNAEIVCTIPPISKHQSEGKI